MDIMSVVFFKMFVFVFTVVLSIAEHPAVARRAFFVFGDSLVDNGNNNYLLTTARADAPPYGIDYPTHQPTGRFSNGRNIPDLISERLGSETTLPYLSPELTGNKLLVGANFASAGIGILNDTGYQFLGVIRMYRQLEHFAEYKQRVSALIGEAAARRLVDESLVLITVGGNDFVNNYYLVPNSKSSQQFNVPEYVKFLISEYRKILVKLYDFGARRILVTGTGPLGCAPAELVQRGNRAKCLVKLQRAAALYNNKLLKMLQQLNKEIGTEAFIAANTGKMHINFIDNPQAYGFVTSRIACCGQGAFNGVGLCTVFSNLCPNRDLYVFWDPYHPSERANKFIVEQMFNGSTEYMDPMNLSTILELDSKI